MKINALMFFMMLVMTSQSGMAQTQPVKGGIAEAIESSGPVRLIKSGVQQRIEPRQRFQTGDILKVVDNSQIEVSYDNGCSEVLSKANEYKIDACRCLTSPYRKGRQDNYNATLNNVSGEVLVYQGEKYQPAKSGMRIRNGDRVMAMRGAGATVNYDHGCVSNVDSFSIHDVDGCKACPLPIEQPLQETQLAQQQPATQTAPTSQPAGPVAATTTPSAGLMNNPGFWGSVVAALLVKELKHDHDDNRRAVSP